MSDTESDTGSDAGARLLARTVAEYAEARGLRILALQETGPKAWGYRPDPGVLHARFVYAHPRDHYLTIREPKTTVSDVELGHSMPNVQIDGLEIRRTLQLLSQSDPGLLAWLFSPQVYAQETGVAQRLRQAAVRHMAPRALAHHYTELAARLFQLHLARGQAAKRSAVFDVVRNVLSARWVVAHRGAPPFKWQGLLAGLPKETPIRNALEMLFMPHADPDEPVQVAQPVADFLLEALRETLEAAGSLPGATPDHDLLDALLRDVLNNPPK